jgi:hypothetical protein
MVLRTQGPERKDVTGQWGKTCLMRSCISCTARQVLSDSWETMVMRLEEHPVANYKSTLERKGKQKINRQTERQSRKKYDYNLEYNKKISKFSHTNHCAVRKI